MKKAVIYSDKEMTSPVGFVKRGKKLVVGEISRNKGQVYPILVSGKVAYIRVLDLSTEKETITSNRLTSERFRRSTQEVPEAKFVASYYFFNSSIDIERDANEIPDNDPVFWHGVSLKGEVLLKNSFDAQVITNFMTASKGPASFRALEVGAGIAYRLIDKRKFLARIEAQLLGIPFSSYTVGEDFRVNSYGYTAGAGFNMTYLFSKNLGAEAFAGVYRTTIFGYSAPSPYEKITPTFTGNRMGIGLNYTY
ncbi:MAG: hypothetical protein ACLGHN_00605 [Bacteriovoracia bacterium]